MNAVQGLSPRQANCLGIALISGILALPIAMLLTKLIATTMPPLMVAPMPLEPRASARRSLAPIVPPVQVLPTESVPPEAAPPAAAPSEPTPATNPPGYASSMPFPPLAQGAPDAAAAPAGSMPLALPGATGATHLALTPHAAVVALLQMMGHAATRPRAAGHVTAASQAARTPRRASTTREIPPSVAASAIDPVSPSVGVRGGPTTRAGTVGLNGTGMRHRL